MNNFWEIGHYVRPVIYGSPVSNGSERVNVHQSYQIRTMAFGNRRICLSNWLTSKECAFSIAKTWIFKFRRFNILENSWWLNSKVELKKLNRVFVVFILMVYVSSVSSDRSNNFGGVSTTSLFSLSLLLLLARPTKNMLLYQKRI